MIEVYAGPMFAGKTEELIRHAKKARYAKWTVAAFVPNRETRNPGRIKSHDANDLEEATGVRVEVAGFADTVVSRSLAQNVKLVLVDEAQFFAPGIVHAAKTLSAHGMTVVLAGLDMTSEGEPFGAMGELMAVADTVVKLKAICDCGRSATRTQARFEKREEIVVGGPEKYAAKCFHCWRYPL